MSLQRRIVTSHDTRSDGSSAPLLRGRDGSRDGPGGPRGSNANAAALDYQKQASRRRVFIILGPILLVLFIIHLVSPSSRLQQGQLGNLPGFGLKSGQSRRTDMLRSQAARQRQKSVAEGGSGD